MTEMLHRLLDWLWDLQGLTCREATRLAANAMDRSLTARERVKLAMHGVLCSYCRNYRRQLRFLRKCVRRMSDPNASAVRSELPAASASRIKGALEKEISLSE
ncbi:MAG: hypothetical protein WAM53_07625 [Terrimicrobiaceae bacterium]